MQGEIPGPDPEDLKNMGVNPEDLSIEGAKPETPQKSDEELTGLARKVFKDEPGNFYPTRRRFIMPGPAMGFSFLRALFCR